MRLLGVQFDNQLLVDLLWNHFPRRILDEAAFKFVRVELQPGIFA
jgi:hypothetical protein